MYLYAVVFIYMYIIRAQKTLKNSRFKKSSPNFFKIGKHVELLRAFIAIFGFPKILPHDPNTTA